jgi:hypothetical protein
MTKSRWVSEMAEAGRGYVEMEDVTSIVLADLDMPELPVSKPTDPSTLEGAAVAIAERHRDAFLAEAGFEHTPGIELDCSNVVIGGVPSGGFVDDVCQIGTAPDGTPLLKVEDYKSGKLPRKGEATVHDQLRIYVPMIEKLTGIRPQQPRAHWRPAKLQQPASRGRSVDPGQSAQVSPMRRKTRNRPR